MSYSIDLREGVLTFIERGGSKAEGSRLFELSRPTIDRWQKLKKEKGKAVGVETPKRPWRKVDPNLLLEYVKKYPDKRLEEYGQYFNVSGVGIGKCLKRLGLTRKKRLFYTKNGMNKEGQYFWELSKMKSKKILCM